ncbi:MAG: T9SS type A sorting domain-containing protein [Saprospiraceae bacterium]|nr:T9SS type A sorting domain-containing protein [Saprospiraceae bacterium]
MKTKTIFLGGLQTFLFVGGFFLSVHVNAQCYSSQLQSTSYFKGDCGQFTFQSATGSISSAYGRCGNFIFSPPFTGGDITTSEDNPGVGSFKIKPNPVFDRLELEYNALQDVRQIHIYNAAGQIVLHVKDDHFFRMINLEHLLPGMYFIRVTFSQSKSITQKFIKI